MNVAVAYFMRICIQDFPAITRKILDKIKFFVTISYLKEHKMELTDKIPKPKKIQIITDLKKLVNMKQHNGWIGPDYKMKKAEIKRRKRQARKARYRALNS